MNILLTDNHYEVLRALRSKPRFISQITAAVRFTRHESRVRRILFDLLAAGLVQWRPHGVWELSSAGQREVLGEDAA